MEMDFYKLSNMYLMYYLLFYNCYFLELLHKYFNFTKLLSLFLVNILYINIMYTDNYYIQVNVNQRLTMDALYSQ